MGLCGSGFARRFEDAIDPLGPFCDKLNITKSELKRAFMIYEKIDGDKSGKINLDEFFDFFELDFSLFAERAFTTMDIDQTKDSQHQLDFAEFYVGTWNYCSMDHGTLVKFAFDMFDNDGSGKIGKDELKKVVAMIHGRKSVDKKVRDMFKQYDDGDGEITLQEWRNMERSSRSLMFPAHTLSRKLQGKFMGERYWKKAAQRRKNRVKNVDLLEMQHLIMTGERLDRQKVAAEANKTKEGTVRSELGSIDVLDGPSSDANKVKSLSGGQYVKIFEERIDENDSNCVWFLVDFSQQMWVMATDIKVDATWLKQEADKKRVEEEAAAAEENARKQQAEKDNQLEHLKSIWMEAKDEKTKKKYWYNKNTQQSTWTNPFKDFE